MAYLLRSLIFLMFAGLALTVALAFHLLPSSLSHIHVAIPAFLYTIFAQAFVMFYFIGISRLATNVHNILHTKKGLEEIFDHAPEDLTPYLEKVSQYVYQTNVFKRQTIPWSMLMLILGMIAFLLGGAHDTGMVSRPVHSGVVYGFLVSMAIGVVRQWYYLGKAHVLLRQLKALFSLPDGQM
jgi:amino acid transporter